MLTSLKVKKKRLPKKKKFQNSLKRKFKQLKNYLPVLLSISVSDIAAYEFGRRYGKRKLYEKISPNKTVEGFFAGLITGSLAMYIVLTNNFEIETIPTLLISLIFILFGVLGDLFESRIKRSLDVKDSSDFLPGHGGVLDRVDSQILSFPVLVLFIQFLDLI